MLVLYMVKPEYVSCGTVSNVNDYYLTPENKFRALNDGFIGDAVKGCESGKSYMPFSNETLEKNCASGVYAVLGDYSGTEKEWLSLRDEISMLLEADDAVPHHNLKSKDIEKNGLKITEIGEDGIHLSAGYEASTKEVCQFVKLMQEYAKNQVKKGNYQLASEVIDKVQSLSYEVASLEGLYKAVKEVDGKFGKRLEGEQAYEVESALKQLKSVSKVTDKACKDLKKDNNKVKYYYV